jgi:tRNA nucleotidyltransferase (CCA-adding enzyme)
VSAVELWERTLAAAGMAERSQPDAGATEWERWRRLLDEGADWPRFLNAARTTGLLEQYPELAATAGVAQNPRWHPEGDVLTHLALSTDAAQAACERDGVAGRDRYVAILGALLHDLGKASTTSVQPGGQITSYGHAAAGVEPARRFLARIDAPSDVSARILPIVEEHMAHMSTPSGPSRRAVARLVRRLEPASIIDWARVVDADRAGRGAGAGRSPAAEWVAIADHGE